MSGALELQLEKHWREHLPKMTADLENQGLLQQRLHETAEQMRDEYVNLVSKQGLNPDQAREITREIGFLPAEEEADPTTSTPSGRLEATTSGTRTRVASDAEHQQIAREMDEAFMRNVQSNPQIQAERRSARLVERDRLFEELKRRVADPGNFGVSNAEFLSCYAGHCLEPAGGEPRLTAAELKSYRESTRLAAERRKSILAEWRQLRAHRPR